ncbi:MAG: ribbon-helix-helix protein, CopG family [Candidatus Rokubacteria bacterium]|nr:ribbon-helix-helix protein, CopG family [Candidatus Rokubacteria bacterium]
MVKMTFTLDQPTADRLRRAAARLGKPQSQVVREAIREYSERIGKLSEGERLRLLQVFDSVVAAIPARPVAEVEEELRAIRDARKRGGRQRRAPDGA